MWGPAHATTLAMAERGSPDYELTYGASLQDAEGFWTEAAEALVWSRRWSLVCDDSQRPFTQWFVGAELNTCFNCVDRHVADGRGEQPALVWESPVTGEGAQYSYAQLRDEVARLAGALRALGVQHGDTVIIYMPMVPEAVFAMLACARIGAVHSVVFGGFAAPELAARIDDCAPRLILSASCGFEPGRVVAYKPLLDSALAQATHRPEHVVVLQRSPVAAQLNTNEYDWHACVAAADPHDCVDVAATDPLYILYTSGTTGRPKGVVRDNGGYAVALLWSMKHVYNVAPGEAFWAASDIGWVVGHSYIVYGPLLNGNTTVLYEGKPVGTPDAGSFWRVVERHRVRTLFTAPTAIRAIRREDPDASQIQSCDLSMLRALFLAGERTDPDTLQWARQHLGVPAIDHWWQTETGWPITAACTGLQPCEVRDGAGGRPVPGYDVRVLNEAAEPVAAGQSGAIAIALPLPPGTFGGLWRARELCFATYFADYDGYYQTADAGYIDADGFVFVMGRTDDVINVAGHRLSSGAMEEVLTAMPDVAECAVCGIDDELKGAVPLGFLVLNAGCRRTHADIVADAVAAIRAQIGPVASFRQALIVSRLPKTRSGKVLRGVMRAIANGREWTVPATIDDPQVITEIERALSEFGLPANEV